MPQLVEAGHLFIAQPPLYKVKRGSQERYLKDEKGLEEYLIGEGLDEAILVSGDGATRAGADLRDIVDTARKIGGTLKGLHSRYPRFVIEQAAIAGALNPKVLKDAKQAQAAAAYIAKRLDEMECPITRSTLTFESLLLIPRGSLSMMAQRAWKTTFSSLR
jgi:DNA gyrase subunit B